MAATPHPRSRARRGVARRAGRISSIGPSWLERFDTALEDAWAPLAADG